MAKPPLRVVSEVRPEDVAGLPILTAYGEPDDHLRLVVLLADTLRARGAGVGLAHLAKVCMDRSSSWETRYDALWDLVRAAEPQQNGAYFGVLFDPDALDPGPLRPGSEWDDREFGWQRSKLRELVERMVKRNGWIVVRPRPSLDIDLPEPTLLAPPEPESDAPLPQTSPEIRPIMSWLVQSGNLTARDVQWRFEAVGGDLGLLERRLVSIAYNALQPRAAEAAERLSIVRHSLVRDQVGPYLILDDRATVAVAEVMEEESWLAREALDELLAAGVLQACPLGDGRTAVRMPRSVRAVLKREADAARPGWMGREHRRLAAPRLEGTGLESQLEVHHHAVRVHPVERADIDRALATAHYYAADLREMAFRLSKLDGRYDDAASVYEQIVRLDPTDGYAWEYLGYNLARAHQHRPPPEDVRERIRDAYDNAIARDRSSDNPLYHGRLLGFRARLGEDITSAFHGGMRRYEKSPNAVSFFAKAVLDGVPASRRRGLIERWRNLLSNELLARYLKEAA
jgi:tetratricopeptide (TPR) repeat protein